jgi:hypothetical protein
MTIKGPTLWEDLHTFEGVLHPSFYAVCLAWGLLQSDDEWQQCLREVATMSTGNALCRLFTLLLRQCEPACPQVLWEEFKANLCDDLHHSLHRVGIDTPSDTDVYDYGLFLLDQKLSNVGMSLSDFPHMPQVQNDWAHMDNNPFLSEQLTYDKPNKLRLANTHLSKLNKE